MPLKEAAGVDGMPEGTSSSQKELNRPVQALRHAASVS